MLDKLAKGIGTIILVKVVLVILYGVLSLLQNPQKQVTEELNIELQEHKELVAELLESPISLVDRFSLQPNQPSEHIISLEKLEKYEKARDAGLQALEDYVISNPDSPYIAQAKDLIRAYKGKR